MKYKLFVSDLDGTLLNDHHKISADNIRAIKQLDKKGIKFVIATGRTKYILEDYLETLDYKMPLIWSNGSAVSDVDGEILYTSQISVSLAEQLIDLAARYDVTYMIHTLEGITATDQNRRIRGLQRYNKSVIAAHQIPISIDQNLYHNLDKYTRLKLSISAEDEADLKAFQTAVTDNIDGVIAVFSDPTLLDITAKEATKGAAVLKLAAKYNIKPEEIVSIGDNENDLSMLAISGLPLTLENGIQMVKDQARYITKSNNHSGVADAIERFVL